jgi:hypothetical protein
VIDRHQQAVRFDEGVEDVLQDVFGVARVGNAAADEIPQPRPFPVDDVGQPVRRIGGFTLQWRRASFSPVDV